MLQFSVQPTCDLSLFNCFKRHYNSIKRSTAVGNVLERVKNLLEFDEKCRNDSWTADFNDDNRTDYSHTWYTDSHLFEKEMRSHKSN